MTAAQMRLDVASINIANQNVPQYHRMIFHAFMTPSGLKAQEMRCADVGALQQTGRKNDIALIGDSGTHAGLRCVDGSISVGGRCRRGRNGELLDESGKALRGRHGALRFPNGAELQANGTVLLDGRHIDQAQLLPGTRVLTGYVRASGDRSMEEMVDLVEAQRNFETAEKVASAVDAVRTKDANEVGKAAQ